MDGASIAVSFPPSVSDDEWSGRVNKMHCMNYLKSKMDVNKV